MAYGNSPLIGSTIDPRLFQQDFSGYADAAKTQAMGMMSLGSAIGQGVGDYMKQQKEEKNANKIGITQIESALKMNLFPDQKPQLESVLHQLKDDNTPISERAVMAKQTPALIDMLINHRAFNSDQQFKERQLGMQERESGMQMQQMGQQLAAGDAALADRQSDDANKDIMGPALLDQVLALSDPNMAARVRDQANGLTGSRKYNLATSLAGLLPKTEKKAAPTIVDVPVKGGTQKMQWDDTRGEFAPIRTTLGESSGLAPGGLPAPLQPYAETFADAGKANGVDPKLLAAIAMHETGNGTSKAFREKNNAMGISDARGPVLTDSVESGIYQMARLLGEGQRGKGPYAGKTTIDEIAKVYAPVGAGNDPRGLNKDWTGGVAANMKRLGADPAQPVGFKPDDATVELDREKKQLEIDKMKHEQASSIQAPSIAIEKSTTLLDDLKRLEAHPGFNGAFGAGLGAKRISGTDASDATVLLEKIKGEGFLQAVQSLKGMGALSDAEGQRLSAAFLGLDPAMSEKAAKAQIGLLKKTVEDTITRARNAPTATATPSAPVTSPYAAATSKIGSIFAQ